MGYSPWGHKESDMTEQLHFLSSPSPETKSSSPGSGLGVPADLLPSYFPVKTKAEPQRD